MLQWQQSENRSAFNLYEEHADDKVSCMQWNDSCKKDFKPITSLLIFNAPLQPGVTYDKKFQDSFL